MTTFRGCGFGPCGRRNLVLPADGLVFVEGPLADLTPQRWHCDLCYVLPLRFPAVEKCGRPIIGGGGQPPQSCDLIVGHPSWVQCRTSNREKVDTSTRDGAPKLAAEKVHTTLSRKKNRLGPLYVPHNRRV